MTMASVFTFDSDPPRVTSLWPTPTTTNACLGADASVLIGSDMPPVMDLANCGVDRLEPEPQEGPIEYKLHLLLRPRRSFVTSSTLQLVSGSHPSKAGSVRLDPQSDLKQMRSSPSPKPSSQSRQNRLQSLTTQLLWRLQQSSPFHSSSRSGLVVPVLPRDGVKEAVANGPDSLRPGLEESQGALYEIGVSDDGAFVGLTEDELEESLNTLRAMAFSLGCKVEVLRRVVVGNCHWFEDSQPTDGPTGTLRYGNLLVAEALVMPNFDVGKQTTLARSLPFEDVPKSTVPPASLDDEAVQITESQTEQLRISLAGSTTSGKSSLLGTLSSSILDNGRGKSRLCLLKHQHEIASGVSSSVTPELIGYQDSFSHGDGGSMTPCINVINYASGNVSSWNDIHSASEPGRLVLLTDSAGHPRYRRTMMRGLISWAPHWTLFCISVDREGDYNTRTSSTASYQESIASVADDGDSSKTHLSLCLKLGLPLVVVVTKLDLASKVRLRQMLNKILSLLKTAGRRPCILPTTTASDQDPLLRSIGGDDEGVIKRIIATSQKEDIRLLVPIIFTSAVNGTGVSQLHALLRHLPIFNPGQEGPGQGLEGHHIPNTLFHVDEVFTRSEGYMQPNPSVPQSETGIVLSGHLRYGEVSVGDHLLVGPLKVDTSSDTVQRCGIRQVGSDPSVVKTSYRKPKLSRQDFRSWSEEDVTGAYKESKLASAWRKVRVESLRNLRLPVHKLLAGQVGTVGISWGHEEKTAGGIASSPRFRKSMVMISCSSPTSDDQQPSSCSGFCASFDEDNALSAIPGSTVTVYIASIRTTARILSINPVTQATESSVHDFCFDEYDDDDADDDDDDDDDNGDDASDSDGGIAVLNPASSLNPHQVVTFRFLAWREWIELGTTVLVLPGGGGSEGRAGDSGGGAGLYGFVGRVDSVLE